MDLDFTPDKNALYIPKEAYRPLKRCPNCQSIYLTDTKCESCGRALDFQSLGEPLTFKSFYRIRERYIASWSPLAKFYPVFEDRSSELAKSYQRNLMKRLRDLLFAFSNDHSMNEFHRKLFYLETKDLITELIDYEVKSAQIIDCISKFSDEDLLSQSLIAHADECARNFKKTEAWPEYFMNYKLFGFLRVQFFLKFTILMATFVFVAIKFRSFIIR